MDVSTFIGDIADTHKNAAKVGSPAFAYNWLLTAAVELYWHSNEALIPALIFDHLMDFA